MNANLAAAAHVVGRKVTNKTKLNYKSKIKIFRSFLSEKEEYRLHLVEDDDFNLPLPDDAVKEFFGWLSTNSELPKRKQVAIPGDVIIVEPTNDVIVEGVEEDAFAENEVTISYSCMAGYKSALAWLYGEKRLKLGAELICYIDDFVKGSSSYQLLLSENSKSLACMSVFSCAHSASLGWCTGKKTSIQLHCSSLKVHLCMYVFR